MRISIAVLLGFLIVVLMVFGVSGQMSMANSAINDTSEAQQAYNASAGALKLMAQGLSATSTWGAAGAMLFAGVGVLWMASRGGR